MTVVSPPATALQSVDRIFQPDGKKVYLIRRICFPLLLVLPLACAMAADAGAQGYPTRPIRFLVPTAPGGGLDVIARLVAPPLTESLGKSVVVDNRPGASGVISLELTARSAADGTDGVGSSPQQFAAHMRAERERWAEAVKQAGLAAQ